MHQSVMTIIADGMDQSKFRVPRWGPIKLKALDSFPRPALHVAGVWCHGHSLQLGVSTPDVPKDSNTNIEMLSIMLDSVLGKGKQLPQHLHLQLDNTSRENKNQKVFRWCMVLVLRGVFRSVSLNFLRKGHTHEDIDGIFGQLAVEIAKTTFDDVEELVDIMLRKLRQLGSDNASRNNSMVFNVDQVADWEGMTLHVNVELAKHTGPNAPHVFKFFRRSDMFIETDSVDREVLEDFPDSMVKHEQDIFMLTRHWMSSRSANQVAAILPARKPCLGAMPRQPVGNRPRKALPPKLMREVMNECKRAAKQKLITPKARLFLEAWATNTLPTTARPNRYQYLEYNWETGNTLAGAVREHVPYDGLSDAVNHVVVRQAVGAGPVQGAEHEVAGADLDLAEEDIAPLELVAA